MGEDRRQDPARGPALEADDDAEQAHAFAAAAGARCAELAGADSAPGLLRELLG